MDVYLGTDREIGNLVDRDDNDEKVRDREEVLTWSEK